MNALLILAWFAAWWRLVGGVGSCTSGVRAQRAESPRVTPDQSPRPGPRPEPRGWALSLLVDADEESKILRPSLRVSGPRTPTHATVRLNVIDGRGDVRLTTTRRFARPEIGADLVLGTLALPDDVSAAEAAGWDWDLVLRECGDELVRRRGPLAAAGSLNDEAELKIPDVPVRRAVDRDIRELVDRRRRPPDVQALHALAIVAFLLEGGELVDLNVHPIDRAAAALIDEPLARRHMALPIGWRDDRLLVAMADPRNAVTVDDLHVTTGCDIHPVAATPDDIVRAIQRLAAEAARPL